MKKNIYDTIIIGGGPAGITAGIYLARRNLNVLIIYKELGGQASITADIENYSGFKFITGLEFTERLKEHIIDYKIKYINENVLKVKKDKNIFNINTDKNTYSSKSVIIASGARQKMLGIPGESEFLNKGVSYCATCDAPLFRDKIVAIVGGGDSALEAAIQLQGYAKKIYILTINDKLKGENVLIDKVKSYKNVEILSNAKTREIKGEDFVNTLFFEQEQKIKQINVEGVFVEIGYLPNSDIVEINKNNYGEILINPNNETSVKGIFAAGDVTNVPVKQIIVAAGEGSKAAIACANYLARMK